MGNPMFKYEKFELLVCIYEISTALVFKYGISGCSRCLTLVTTVNPIPFQVQLIQLFPSQLNHVSPWKCQFTSSWFLKGVSILHSSPFGSVHVLQQGTFKHILIKYFRQDSEIDFIDLHNNGICPYCRS